jgi:hypothetical protein
MSSLVLVVTKRLQHATVKTPLNRDTTQLADKRVIIAENKQNIGVHIRKHVLEEVKQTVNSVRENTQKDILARLFSASINGYTGRTFSRSLSST